MEFKLLLLLWSLQLLQQSSSLKRVTLCSYSRSTFLWLCHSIIVCFGMPSPHIILHRVKTNFALWNLFIGTSSSDTKNTLNTSLS